MSITKFSYEKSFVHRKEAVEKAFEAQMNAENFI